MKDHESIVRKAAQKLHDAIAEAEAAGFRIIFPRHHGGLSSLAISETGKRVPEEKPVSGSVDGAASDYPDELKDVMAENSKAVDEALADKGE